MGVKVRMLTSYVGLPGTIIKLASQGYKLLVSRRRKRRNPGYVCDIARHEVQW